MKEQDLYYYKAVIERWVDADTVVVDVDLGFHIHRKETVRVMGYDAPEVRKYEGVSDEEKQLGVEAKAIAVTLLPRGTQVLLKSYYDRTGKFGRFLADILFTDEGWDRWPEGADLIDYAEHMKALGYVKED